MKHDKLYWNRSNTLFSGQTAETAAILSISWRFWRSRYWFLRKRSANQSVESIDTEMASISKISDSIFNKQKEVEDVIILSSEVTKDTMHKMQNLMNISLDSKTSSKTIMDAIEAQLSDSNTVKQNM